MAYEPPSTSVPVRANQPNMPKSKPPKGKPPKPPSGRYSDEVIFATVTVLPISGGKVIIMPITCTHAWMNYPMLK